MDFCGPDMIQFTKQNNRSEGHERATRIERVGRKAVNLTPLGMVGRLPKRLSVWTLRPRTWRRVFSSEPP